MGCSGWAQEGDGETYGILLPPERRARVGNMVAGEERNGSVSVYVVVLAEVVVAEF